MRVAQNWGRCSRCCPARSVHRASNSSLSDMISLQMRHSIMLTWVFFCCYTALQICKLTCCPLYPTALIWSLPFSKSTSFNVLVSIYFPSYVLIWIILRWFSFSLLVPASNFSGSYCVCLSTAMDNGRSYSCFCSVLFIFWSPSPPSSWCLFAPSLPATVPLAHKWSTARQLCLASVRARENLLDLKSSSSS